MELEVLGDRYELKEPIGRGGMATIYRAVDLRMGRTVAAKILREVYSSDPKFVTRFQREALAASVLQHPNIVQVFDYGQSGESYFIVMEFVDGSDLRRYMKKRGVLDPERVVEIAHDVALGLGAAHKKGIVHRDIKPQNIMLNDSRMVKLTDFGIASMYKDVEAERLTTTGMTLGTVQYYAPEQAQGEMVTPAADIYALGIVMYEMLTGRTPFDGDTPVAVAMKHIQEEPERPSVFNPNIPPGLEKIVLRCLEKDPRDRYRDGDALAYALETFNRGGRRASGAVGPASRPQFPPFGLPVNDPRPTGATGGFGGPAVVSGPRGSRVMSQPIGARQSDMYGGYGDPTVYGGPDPALSTRPFGPAGGTVPRSPASGRPSGPYGMPPGDQRKRGSGPITAVIVSSAVLLLGLTCFLALTLSGTLKGLGSAFNAPTPTATLQLTTVPDFSNETFDQAQAMAATAHLQVSQTPVPSATVKVGLVVNQLPAAQQQVLWGTVVKLQISTGPKSVQIPNVVGHPMTDAQLQLQQLGLQVQVKFVSSATVASGDVIRSDPPAGQQVSPSSTVTLYVSAGAPTPVPTATPTAAPTSTPCPTVISTATPTPSGC